MRKLSRIFRNNPAPVTAQIPGCNLQDGLFQIASHTCNILVQVNNNAEAAKNGTEEDENPNTNLYVSTSNALNSALPEQLMVLIPSSPQRRGNTKSGKWTGYNNKKVPQNFFRHNDDIYGYNAVLQQPYYMPSESDSSPAHYRRFTSRKTKWCRPSCIPISVICIMIFLVVLLPLLDHITESKSDLFGPNSASCKTCSEAENFRMTLVESIPIGMNYSKGTIQNPSTYVTWLSLINDAQNTIDIASFYWTLRSSEVYPNVSTQEGQTIYRALLKAGTKRGIKIRIAQNLPSGISPDRDTYSLSKMKAATVRSLNFNELVGGGVLHTKFIVVDRRHFYVGSANMDWRSLTQVKELGVAVYNCTCLAHDLLKIFEVYWTLGAPNVHKVPPTWPSNVSTLINVDNPLKLKMDNGTFSSYLTSSPLPFNPTGRTNDIDGLLNVIQSAKSFIYIAVMDYFPMMIYTPEQKFWPIIDNALRKAAIERQIHIKLLISQWKHSRKSEDFFLKSFAALNQVYPGVSIEIRRFVVPSTTDNIPFTRVNHNKYMVTDNTVYIGTSNWSGDYFTTTAGVAYIVQDSADLEAANRTTLRSKAQAVFERDWASNYSVPISI